MKDDMSLLVGRHRAGECQQQHHCSHGPLHQTSEQQAHAQQSTLKHANQPAERKRPTPLAEVSAAASEVAGRHRKTVTLFTVRTRKDMAVLAH